MRDRQVRTHDVSFSSIPPLRGITRVSPFSVARIGLDAVSKGIVVTTERLVGGENVWAIFFECTDRRPYVKEVQDATVLPVFDYPHSPRWPGKQHSVRGAKAESVKIC
jgi:hypothetical protein